jgi:hypothetical protein
MSATWILRRIDTGKVIWTGVGADNPDVVVDPSVYRSIFAQSFPHVALTWGSGEFEVVYSGDATYKVGPVSAYTITRTSPDGDHIETSEDFTILAENLKVAATELGAGAHIVSDFDAEVHARLGQGGLPLGIRVEDGIPQPVVKDVTRPLAVLEDQANAGVAKRAADDPLPLEEAADFTMLLKNAKKVILPRREDWPRVIEGIPSAVIRHFTENSEGINLDTDEVLTGRMFVGMEVDFTSSLPVGTFLVDDCSPKTRLYIRWQLNYQQVESQVLDQMEGKQDLDAQECYKLCLEMFHDATELYLREKGWEPKPGEEIKACDIYPEVLAEMRARADFVARKDAEYGQPIRRHGIYGVVVRIFDKIARFTNLKAGAVETPTFESALDSLKDLGGYSLILAGMFLEEVIHQTPKTEKA